MEELVSLVMKKTGLPKETAQNVVKCERQGTGRGGYGPVGRPFEHSQEEVTFV